MDERQLAIGYEDVVGTKISLTSYDQVLALFRKPRNDRATIVAVCNVHSVMSARRDPLLREALRNADVATPDGMPLVWAIRTAGHRTQRRVAGPDLMMKAVFEDNPHRHFLYGGSQDVLDELVARIRRDAPNTEVVGAISPPFRRLSDKENEEDLLSIRRSNADVVWVGLGMPKQELWIASVAHRLPGTTLVGVGAAFDFLAGKVRRAPKWMQASGLEWLFRLMQEPRRMWRRYIVDNPTFVVRLVGQRLRRGGRTPKAGHRSPDLRTRGTTVFGIYLTDLNPRATDSHGVANYALRLAQGLTTSVRDDERLVIFANHDLLDDLPQGVETVIMRTPKTWLGRLASGRQALRIAREREVNLLHFPKGFLPIGRKRGVALVATIHDDILRQYSLGKWRHPAPIRLRLLRFLLERSMVVADALLTVSLFSRSRLVEWAGTRNTSVDPVVTHLGVDEYLDVGAARQDPFFLVFASAFPHKRSGEALAFLERFIDEQGLDHRIRVVGSAAAPGGGIIDVVERPVTADTILDFVRAAEAVVTASEYEGFGLLPIEAYSMGSRCVFALNAAASELYAWLPGAFEVGSYTSFCAAMQEVMSLRLDQRRRIQKSVTARFKWEATARETLVAYRNVLLDR